MSTSAVTTHVLDTARGRPAVGVPVRLSRLDADVSTVVGAGETDEDGRCAGLAAPELEPGTYRLHFDTAAYFQRTEQEGFFPEVSITLLLGDAGHVHVPLLLSPFAYSTYRGS
jgi:5-hydroxyisourate hydrolase